MNLQMLQQGSHWQEMTSIKTISNRPTALLRWKLPDRCSGTRGNAMWAKARPNGKQNDRHRLWSSRVSLVRWPKVCLKAAGLPASSVGLVEIVEVAQALQTYPSSAGSRRFPLAGYSCWETTWLHRDSMTSECSWANHWCGLVGRCEDSRSNEWERVGHSLDCRLFFSNWAFGVGRPRRRWCIPVSTWRTFRMEVSHYTATVSKHCYPKEIEC